MPIWPVSYTHLDVYKRQAFNDITDNMDLAEDFIKYCVQWALDDCYDDVKFLNDMFDKGLIERCLLYTSRCV